ncbi:hypothetical protein NHQ30_009767 [Ciborinia camelliae]|nr:hypothetical protein NHQ30_009767 [Ciborinia camelliae]
MSKRSRPPPGQPETYGYSSVPAPASATASEFQGPVQQNIINTTEQWTFDNGYNDPNFGYMIPLPVGNNLGSQYGPDTSRASRDPNSLERSSVTEESLLDLLDGSHTPDKPARIIPKANPKQLPEALKYLAPIPTQRNVSHQSENPQSRLVQQPSPHDILRLRQSPQNPHHPHQQVPNAHPSPSPEPHLSRPRRTAKAKRRREHSPSPSSYSPFGSEWWESDASLCWRCRKHNANKAWSYIFYHVRLPLYPFLIYASNQDLAHMEENLRAIPRTALKTKTWRMFSAERAEKAFDHDFDNVVFRDHFVLAQEQARSTGVFDEKYSDLMAIAQTYQESILQPVRTYFCSPSRIPSRDISSNIKRMQNKSLEASCRILIECCELYKCFITTTMPAPPIPVLNLLEKIRTTRSTMRRAFKEYQALALAPSDFRSRRDWLPSFLSACSLAISAVVFIDMMIAMPSPYKERIWGVKWHERITDIRHGGYGMMLEVLRANTKNVNPLELSCWNQDFGIDTNFQISNNDPHDAFAGDQFINTPYSSGYVDLSSQPQQFPYGLATATATATATQPDFTPDMLYANAHYDAPTYYADWQQTQTQIQMQMQQQAQAAAAEERRILLGENSPEALHGMLAVKSWQLRNYEHLKLGEDIFKKDLYRQATINPIAGLWRIFDMK